MVETDAAEAHRGFILTAGRGDDDDGMVMIQDRSGPGGVLAVEADIDAAGEMSGAKFIGLASVKNLRALGPECQESLEGQGSEFPFEGFIESGALLAV